jgi:hypothetical protein
MGPCGTFQPEIISKKAEAESNILRSNVTQLLLLLHSRATTPLFHTLSFTSPLSHITKNIINIQLFKIV